MTEKKDFPVFRVGIVTLSDKGYQGEREDKSGPRIKELLPAEQYEVVSMRLLPDERAMIEEELIRLADLEQCDLVLTTGGTGFSMRDVTPEATLAVSGRVAPGIAEAIRAGSMAITKRAMLSRAVSAIRHRTLIINLPGSPKAVARKVTGQLFRRQSQHQHDADRQGEKTDNINGTHAPPPFINRCNVSCGTPPRMSLAQRDGDGVFSLQNSPSMRNAPSAKRLSVMWYLYSVR